MQYNQTFDEAAPSGKTEEFQCLVCRVCDFKQKDGSMSGFTSLSPTYELKAQIDGIE